MKKNLKLLLALILVCVPAIVCASEEYVNYYGIEMSEEEYNNLIGLGFTEEEIHHMELEEFNANKDIDSSLEAVTTKYYVNTTRFDSLGRVIYTNSNEVTEAEYNEEQVMTFDYGYVETSYKMLTTTISQAGSRYRYKVTLTWKQMPAVRSYDIIGIGIEPALVYIYGDLHFNQTYCISNNCTNTPDINSTSYYFNGGGVSFKLPSSTSITGLRQWFYFDVDKEYNGTITGMYADGDYSHATRTISGDAAQGFYVNQAGIDLFDEIYDYYDRIDAATASWTGSW